MYTVLHGLSVPLGIMQGMTQVATGTLPISLFLKAFFMVHHHGLQLSSDFPQTYQHPCEHFCVQDTAQNILTPTDMLAIAAGNDFS